MNRHQEGWAFVSLFLMVIALVSASADTADVRNWGIEFFAEVPGIAVDGQNYAGVLPDAEDDYDIFDVCTDGPPPPVDTDPEYLNLLFPHPEFVSMGAQSERCNADFRAPFSATAEWRMVLETNLSNTDILLYWDLHVENAEVPGEYRLELLDDQKEFLVNLREANEFWIPSGTQHFFSRTFYLRVTNDPPSAPEGVKVTGGAGGCRVEWEVSSEPDVNAHVVYYGDKPGDYSFSYLAEGVTWAVIRNLEVGKDYYFAVSARDRSGLESPLSQEVSARPLLLGDVTGNQAVNYEDLFQASIHWYSPITEVDFNFDSVFDEKDIVLFYKAWQEER